MCSSVGARRRVLLRAGAIVGVMALAVFGDKRESLDAAAQYQAVFVASTYVHFVP